MFDKNTVVRQVNDTTIHNKTVIEETSIGEIKRSNAVSKFVTFDSGSAFEKTVFATSCPPFIFRLEDVDNRDASSPRDWYTMHYIHRTPIQVLQCTIFGKNKFIVEYVEVGDEVRDHYNKAWLLRFKL